MSAADDRPSPQPMAQDGLTRRDFFRRTAATGTALGGMAIVGEHAVPQFSPVGRAQALAPLVVAGAAAVVGGASVGWVLRGVTADDADTTPEGLAPEVLKNELYTTSRKRYSDNKSTFVDNRNIVETGFEHSLYGDGKVAAIEALNNEETQQAVTDAAHAAAEESATTVIKNFLKSWNASVQELENMRKTVRSHSDVTIPDVTPYGSTYMQTSTTNIYAAHGEAFFRERQHTLPDGSTITIKQAELSTDNQDEGAINAFWWGPVQRNNNLEYDGTNGASKDNLEWPLRDGRIRSAFEWTTPDGNVL
ncbi:hypothetical protein C477_12772, partial [Haloterrigena salina JCM 13891]